MANGTAHCRGSRMCQWFWMTQWRPATRSYRSLSSERLSKCIAEVLPPGGQLRLFHKFRRCRSKPSAAIISAERSARSAWLRPLCRFYDNEVGSISNSYAVQSTFGHRKRITGAASMSVIPVDVPPDTSAASRCRGASGKGSRWHWTSISPSERRRTVPEATLRRSRQDFERCRRLMHKTSMAAVAAGAAGHAVRSVP